MLENKQTGTFFKKVSHAMSRGQHMHLADDDFSEFLRGGKWSVSADDNITGETISRDAASRIVERYNSDPGSPAARDGLGLLALTLGVAEWGLEGTPLPDDPAGKGWRSDTGEDSGKHLMSYGVGGVGISHADVGDLEEYVHWLSQSPVVPSAHRRALLRLTELRYGRRDGIVYDELRAAGRCAETIGKDLLGEEFHHFVGPAGAKYCSDYENGALTPQDWLVFRTWVRASLRTESGQRYLLALWFRDYWRPTLEQVPDGEGAAEEMLVNVRVRNSAPAVARSAHLRRPRHKGAAGRVQRQLDAYADWKPRTAHRRWKIMMRPVAIYRSFSGLPPLNGVGL